METAEAPTKAQVKKPLCPVCHQADQVKRLQKAYETGVEHVAPPELPVGTATMSGFIMVSIVLVGIGVFFIFVLSAAGTFGVVPEIVQIVLTLAAIVAALVLSFIAFQRLVKGDQESTLRLPAWDRAMETWRRLYYCSRDNVVFDPTQDKVLSEQALRTVLQVDDLQTAGATSSASASHS